MADTHDYDETPATTGLATGADEAPPPAAKRPRTKAQMEAWARCKAKRDALVESKRAEKEALLAAERQAKQKARQIERHQKLYQRQIEELHSYVDSDEDPEELLTGGARTTRAPPPSPPSSPSPPPSPPSQTYALDLDDLAARIARQLQPAPAQPAPQPEAPTRQNIAAQQAKRTIQPQQPVIRFV